MSNKLTGREAVIALMQMKSVKRKDRVLQYFEDEDAFIYFGSPFRAETFENIVAHDDWEIAQEPLVWEDEQTVGTRFYSNQLTVSGKLVSSDCKEVYTVIVPDSFKDKRVKVRIEEIL